MTSPVDPTIPQQRHPVVADLGLPDSLPRKPVRCGSGEVLFREGGKCEGVFVIEEGQVDLFTDYDSQPHRLQTAGPGCMLGLTAFLTQKQYASTAVALTPVRLSKISCKDFQDFLTQVPEKWTIVLENVARDSGAAVGALRKIRLGHARH